MMIHGLANFKLPWYSRLFNNFYQLTYISTIICLFIIDIYIQLIKYIVFMELL